MQFVYACSGSRLRITAYLYLVVGKYYRAGHYVCSRVYKVHTSLLNSDVVKLSSLHKLIATNWLQAKWSTRMCYTTGRYILYCSINNCNKTGSGRGSILKT